MSNLLVIYSLLVLIAIGVSLIAVFNFLRYKFRGDMTYVFITIFALLFGVTVISTLLLLNTSGLNPGSTTEEPSF